jgi:MFS family permease
MAVPTGLASVGKSSLSIGQSAQSLGRYRWYVLAVLTFAQACHALDRSLIGLVLEPVKHEFLLSDRQAGVLAGLSYGIAFAIAAIPFGMAVDRFNRRNLLVVALSLWSGCTLLCGLVNSYVALLFARSAVGAAEAGGSPTGMSLLTDYFRPGERASAVGLWYVSSGVGTLLAFMIGGYVAQHLGWRWVFILGGLPGIVMAVMLLLTVREPARGGMDPAIAAPPSPTTVAGAETLGLGRRIGLVMRAPGLAHCIIGLILAAIASSGIIAWVTPLLLRAHHVQISTAGVIVALCIGLASSLGGGASGLLVDAINRRRGFAAHRSALFAAAMPTLSVIFGTIAFLSPSTTVSVVFLMLLGVVIAAYNGPANGLVVTVSDRRVRGLSVAIVQFGANLVGFGFGPVFIGEVSEALGGGLALRWGMVAVLGFYLWSALHFLLAAAALKRHAMR